MQFGDTGTVKETSIKVRKPGPGQASSEGAVSTYLPFGAAVTVLNDFGDGWPFIQSGTGASLISGFIDASNVDWKGQSGGGAKQDPSPPQNGGAQDGLVPNYYPKLNVLAYEKTKLPMSDFVVLLKGRRDISNEVKCALYVMWANESAYGSAGINNNFGGFQADVGHWSAKYDGLINGTCVVVDSGGHRRRFLCFTDWQSCVQMFAGIIADRGIYVGGTTSLISHMSVDTPETWVLAYFREWVTGEPTANPSSDTVKSLGHLYHEAESALGAVSNSETNGGLPVGEPGRPEFEITSGNLPTLINTAKTEAGLRSIWTSAIDPAEKYLAPLRSAMSDLGQIGAEPVFYDWCAAFVTWCCRQAGYQVPDQPQGFWATMALVDSWKYWASQNGTLISTHQNGFAFVPGDILLFQWNRSPTNLDYVLDHIGICVDVIDNSNVSSAEGNTNKPGQTEIKERKLGNIAGIIRFPQ